MNSKDELAKREANYFVPTPQSNLIIEAVETCCLHREYTTPGSTSKCIFIIGDSGIGKSRALYYSCNQVNANTNQDNDKALPAVMVNVPVPYTLLGLYLNVLEALGETVTRRVPLENAINKVSALIKARNVKVLIFDGIEIISHEKYAVKRDAMETLIRLSDTDNVSIIGCGTPTTQGLLLLDPKYSRRFTVLQINPFSECNDEFISLLEAIEKEIDAPFALGFSNKKTPVPELFFSVSGGYISRLTQLIHELFLQIGLYDNAVDLSEMKVTVDAIISASEKIYNSEKQMKRRRFNQPMKEDSGKTRLKYKGVICIVEEAQPKEDMSPMIIELRRLDNGALIHLTFLELLRDVEIIDDLDDAEVENSVPVQTTNISYMQPDFTSTDAIYPMQNIVMGYKLLDAFIIDEKTKIILGRPWLHIGLDLYSFCIFGIHLSLAHNSENSAIKVLLNGVLEKHAKEKYGTLYDWDVYGRPKLVTYDNCADYISDEINRATAEVVGAAILYRPLKITKLHYPIETFFMALNTELKNTFPYSELGDVSPEQYPSFTLDELRTLIVRFIVEVYHYTALGFLPEKCNIPMDRFHEGIEKFGSPRTITPEDEPRFTIEMMRQKKRTLYHKGILLGGILYNSSELSALNMPDVKHDIKYDDDDVSFIYLLDPRTNNYLYVPAVIPPADTIAGLSRYNYNYAKFMDKKEPK